MRLGPAAPLDQQIVVAMSMRILALETTEAIGSLAAWADGRLLAELSLESTQRSAQCLAPGLKALLGRVGWYATDIDLVAVTMGPGSFTGLRVGVTAAKTLAYCAGAELLGVDTLETIAAATPDGVDAVSVATDAQRGEVMVGRFRRASDGWLRPEAAARLLRTAEWLNTVEPGQAVSGPILRKLADRVPACAVVLPPTCWHPTAANVARLAQRDYATGRRDDLWTFAPRYSRPSAAEEKWNRRASGV